MKLIHTVAWGRTYQDGSSDNITHVYIEDDPVSAQALFHYYRTEYLLDRDPLRILNRSREVEDHSPTRFTGTSYEYIPYVKQFSVMVETFELVEE